MTAPVAVDVLREAVERASNAMGLTDDAMLFESDGEEALAAVAELIAKGNWTIAAFEAMGKAVGVRQQLSARTECELALVALKDALASFGAAP